LNVSSSATFVIGEGNVIFIDGCILLEEKFVIEISGKRTKTDNIVSSLIPAETNLESLNGHTFLYTNINCSQNLTSDKIEIRYSGDECHEGLSTRTQNYQGEFDVSSTIMLKCVYRGI